jgi:hypothetical protein
MQTYRECVYMVFDELKLDSDDSRIEVEHIIFLLNKYRAILAKQRYGGTKRDVPLEYYQIWDLGYLDLPVNNTDVRRTFSFNKPVPSILNLHGILLETSISYNTAPIEEECIIDGTPVFIYNQSSDFVENNIDVNFINPDRFKYLGYNKWLTSQPYATIGYDHKLYISSTADFLNGKRFRIQGIFENPTDFQESTDGKLDMYFPVEQALVQPIIDLIVKELGNVLYLPKDGENNSSDDISIPMNSYQPPKVRSKTSIDE